MGLLTTYIYIFQYWFLDAAWPVKKILEESIQFTTVFSVTCFLN